MSKKAKVDTKNLMLRGKTWYVKRMVDGKVLMQSTHKTTVAKAREVRDRLLEKYNLTDERERMAAVQASIDTIDSQIQAVEDRAPSMTLLQVWEAFKLKPKGKTPRGRTIMPGERTLKDYEGRWKAFCKWMEDKYPKKDKDENLIPWELRQINKGHAERYIAEVGSEASGNTRNKTLTFLRLVFKVMSEAARIKVNPFEGIDASTCAVSRKRPLTMTELGAVSKLLVGKGEMELLFSLGYYTGARLGDCVLMRWDCIDLGARKIRYTPHKTAKGNHEITLTIASALFTLLEAIPKKKRKGLVLPELGELYKNDPAAVSKRIQKVFTDADIETDLEVKGYKKNVARVGFHSLRHAHITALLEGGVPMDMVRQQAGHSTIGMTAHYYHASEASLQAVTDALPAMTPVQLPPTAPVQVDIAAVLAVVKGMTAKTWKTDRDKLLGMLEPPVTKPTQTSGTASIGAGGQATQPETPVVVQQASPKP